MINIISKPLEFDYELKKKIEFICDFCEYSVLRVPLIRDRIPSVAQSVPLTY